MLGVPLDPVAADQVDSWLRATLVSDDGRCRHLVTLNPEYVMTARSDPAFAATIREADLVVADGIGVVLAARALTGERTERITGVALAERLATLSGEVDAPAFLLGAGPGVAEEARQRLLHRHPAARFAAVWDRGTPRPNDDDAT